MKRKLFTLLIVLLASIKIAYASIVITVNGIRFKLDEDSLTASVTYTSNEIPSFRGYNEGWSIDTAIIPSAVEYDSQIYNVTSIGEHAFQNCINLSFVSIPAGVTNIESHAFQNCPKLPAISFPSSVTTIGYYAFTNCISLKTIEIPENIISVHLEAFRRCSSLISVIWNAKNCADYLCVIDGSEQPYPFPSSVTSFEFGDKVEKIPAFLCYGLQGLTHVSLPPSVKSIGERAFGATGLVTIDMPDSLRTIGKYAFYGCSKLMTITIPKNVTSIETEAFYWCSSLSSVNWNAKKCIAKINDDSFGPSPFYDSPISSFVFGDSVEFIPQYLCYHLNDLTSIVVTKNVTQIEKKAFARCENLHKVIWLAKSVENLKWNYWFNNDSSITEFVFGNEVTHIPSYLCSEMDKLTEVAIPQSIASIGENAFSSCSGLTKVEVENLSTWCSIIFDNVASNPLSYAHHLYLKNSEIINLTIPDDISRIEKCAFAGGSEFLTVSIPDNILYIGISAFSMCSNIRSLNIPTHLSCIEGSTFYECSNLSSINLPDGILSIGDHSFARCRSIVSVDIPNSTTSIGASAFSECKKLTEVNLPDSLTYLGMCAFYQCPLLANVKMPRFLSKMSQAVFSSDSSLVSIIIPKSVTAFDSYVFSRCSSLSAIYMLPEIPPTIKDDVVSNDVPIYVPCGTLEAYKLTRWGDYNIQNQSNIFEFNVSSSDTTKGMVFLDDNICLSSIYATPKVGYHFVQWSDGNTDNPREIVLTQDTSFMAIFAANIYTITFVDDNDTILVSQEVEYNTMPVPPANPVKKEDEQFTYTFAGWSPTIVPATEDAAYKATYTAKPKSEGIEDIFFEVKPQKVLENGNIHIFLPDGRKYSIFGNQIK